MQVILSAMKDAITSVRIDKWLWAARFFKTRSLATEAVSGGKVHLNGDRVKPSRAVTVGQQIKISKDRVIFEIVVLGISDKRGPASVAQALYQELESSLERRESEAVDSRVVRQIERGLAGVGRPDKRQRRQRLAWRDTNDAKSREEE